MTQTHTYKKNQNNSTMLQSQMQVLRTQENYFCLSVINHIFRVEKNKPEDKKSCTELQLIKE